MDIEKKKKLSSFPLLWKGEGMQICIGIPKIISIFTFAKVYLLSNFSHWGKGNVFCCFCCYFSLDFDSQLRTPYKRIWWEWGLKQDGMPPKEILRIWEGIIADYKKVGRQMSSDWAWGHSQGMLFPQEFLFPQEQREFS